MAKLPDDEFSIARYVVKASARITGESSTGRVILQRVDPDPKSPMTITVTGPSVFDEFGRGTEFEIIFRKLER